MKLLQKILLVAATVTIVGGTDVIGMNPPAQPNQIQIFNDFADGSWKSFDVPALGQLTVQEWLVNQFNVLNWRPHRAQAEKIDRPIPNLVRDYYMGLGAANPAEWMNWVRSDKRNRLKLNDSPRQWMDKLDLRELYRFANLVAGNPNLINNANHGVDDLIKARSLCGVFWEVDATDLINLTATRSFSGMLKQEQIFDNHLNEYEVYTCGHGFVSENSQDNISYYFVPYGVHVDDADPHGNNFITKKGFKVTAIKFGSSMTFSSINGASLTKRNVQTNQYVLNDYAVVRIEKKSGDNITLKNSLIAATVDGIQLNIINNGSVQLPNINTTAHVFPGNFNPTNNERLFVIGLSTADALSIDDSDIIVSTCIRNDDNLSIPRRSLDDDENVKTPNRIGNKNEYSSSLATYYGMSGGPILRCHLTSGNSIIKSCLFIGTLWGGEREFVRNVRAETLNKFGCFINRAQ